MYVILQCKAATHNEQMLTLPCFNLFQIFSAVFLPNIIWTGLKLGKLSQI